MEIAGVSSRTGGELVLLVEDEPSISEPFSRALAREGFLAVIASTVAEARALLEEREPDIVLLDLMLPDGDGRELAREVRAKSQVPIIMLTARGSEIDRVVGLELGADDYVVKPFAAAEVIARIRAVLRRSRRREPIGRLTAGDVTIDVGARRAWLEGRELSLTRKEFDLLARLARSAGQVVTREDLMSDVWDENWFGSTKTLDVHMTALRRKLGEDSAAPRHIQTVRGVGFRFAPAQEG
jgi:two-component system, OmpR family, response regulator RegX3